MAGRVMVSFNWLIVEDWGGWGVKGAGVGSAYIDTTHRHHLLCTHTLIHTHTHTHLHSAMMSWQLRLVLYSSIWKPDSIRGWDSFANYATI